MPIRTPSSFKPITFAKGVDNTTEVDSPDIQGTLSVGLNTDLVSDSMAIKRQGYTVVNSSAWSTRKIRSGINYQPESGSAKRIVYGEATTKTGSSGIVGYINGTSITTISSGLKDTYKPVFLQFRNLLFFFNGYNDFVYDGTNVKQIGITPPANAPVFSSYTTGELVADSSYLWAYTYYNSATGAESTPSDPSVAVATGSTSGFQGVVHTVLPGDSTTADTIRMYRTTAGGATFFLAGTAPISATSFTSIDADATLGAELELDNSRPIGYARYTTTCNNRIFLAGFTSNPNRIHYSKIGQTGPMPESFQADDFVDCNLNDGDIIVGVGVINDTVIVQKQRSLGRLVRIDAQVGGVEVGGSNKYVYEEISNEVEGTTHHCMGTFSGMLAWVGSKEIYATDGNRLYRLGQRILNTLDTLNYNYTDKWSVITKLDTKQIIWSVTRSGMTEPDFQIVGHYRYFERSGELAFTFYSPGTDTTTHPGLQAGCFFPAQESGQVVYYFGNSSGDGRVYKMDTGTNDNTKGIYWDLRTPWFSGNIPEALKTFHSYYLFAAGKSGATYSVTQGFERDRTESIVASTSSSLSGTGTSQWGVGTWGNFTWGGVRYTPIRFFPKLKAYYGRYSLTNFNADEPVVVQSIKGIVQVESIHR